MTDLRETAQQMLKAWDDDENGTTDHPLSDTIEALRAALAQQEQTCNCRWVGDVQTQQCTLHEAHVDAIHEWAERAKAAEAKLAQQEQGPVAWRFKGMMGMPWSLSDDGYYVSCKRDKGYIVEPLYTAPPRREWQSLTDQEVWDAVQHGVVGSIGLPSKAIAIARPIEAKLKEKNNG